MTTPKGGRPVKPDNEKRSEMVRITLTKEERREVEERAKAARKNMSEYIRDRIL